MQVLWDIVYRCCLLLCLFRRPGGVPFCCFGLQISRSLVVIIATGCAGIGLVYAQGWHTEDRLKQDSEAMLAQHNALDCLFKYCSLNQLGSWLLGSNENCLDSLPCSKAALTLAASGLPTRMLYWIGGLVGCIDRIARNCIVTILDRVLCVCPTLRN